MTETTITVAEATRNPAEYIDRAHNEQRTFVLLQDGVPVAKIVPADRPACSGVELAKAVER